MHKCFELSTVLTIVYRQSLEPGLRNARLTRAAAFVLFVQMCALEFRWLLIHQFGIFLYLLLFPSDCNYAFSTQTSAAETLSILDMLPIQVLAGEFGVLFPSFLRGISTQGLIVLHFEFIKLREQ